MGCALMEVLTINGYIHSEKHVSYYALTLVTTFLTLALNPFDCFYRKFRLELLKSLWLTMISPFGEVRFKDFFLGDVLCSAVKPLADVAFITCYFTTDQWKNLASEAICVPDDITLALITFLPYHFRFWQCVNKWWYTGQWFPHLVNAAKYLSSIVTIVMNYLLRHSHLSLEYFIGFYIFTTLFAFAWDMTMDWGVF